MRIAIHGKRFIEKTEPVIQKIFDSLRENKGELILSEEFASHVKKSGIKMMRHKTYNSARGTPPADTIFSIGGDGTLLETVTHVGRKGTPILGINTGKLGFLATVSKENIDSAIEKIFKKDYKLDKRTLLNLHSKEKIFSNRNFALNDFTILKRDTSSMIVVHLFLNNEFLNSYWADGLIVSTPTGSTGYSLSCGGPIVLAHSNNFVITPVSGHNLSVRPLVVPDDNELSFKIEGRKRKVLISLDSRYETVDMDIELKISKADFRISLIKIEGIQFFDTLRQKLNWGYDVRN
jgi:NAD+ kinase